MSIVSAAHGLMAAGVTNPDVLHLAVSAIGAESHGQYDAHTIKEWENAAKGAGTNVNELGNFSVWAPLAPRYSNNKHENQLASHIHDYYTRAQKVLNKLNIHPTMKLPGTPSSAHLPTGDSSGLAEPGLHVGNPLSWTTELATFLSKLLDPHTWVRVGEVAVGGVLVVVAIGAMTKTNPIGKAAKWAK